MAYRSRFYLEEGLSRPASCIADKKAQTDSEVTSVMATLQLNVNSEVIGLTIKCKFRGHRS